MKILKKYMLQLCSIEGREIIAPVGDTILVIVDGVKFSLPTTANEETVFGVYTITRENTLVARYTREPDKREVNAYLNLLPVRYFIWLENDTVYRYGADNTIEDISHCTVLGRPPDLFDVVLCRISAGRKFLTGPANRDTATSRRLRDAFNQRQKMPRVGRFFTGAWEYKQDAFEVELAKQRAALEKLAKERAEVRSQGVRDAVQRALQFSGSELLSLTEDGDSITVEYRVPHVSRRFRSTIRQNDNLDVISAGVCLNGNDSLYTLKTLPLIIQEGHKHGRGDWQRDWQD